MPKLKTKKTLLKRIKISKNGKIIRKHPQTGHLKNKLDSSSNGRKNKRSSQTDKGHKVGFKKLLGKAGKRIKI